MRKPTDKAAEPEMRAEYDFSRGVRGKYARRYAQGANVVVLEADVAKVFPNAEAVNDSLRALAGISRRQHKALAGKQARTSINEGSACGYRPGVGAQRGLTAFRRETYSRRGIP
jgi:hypothetical protein